MKHENENSCRTSGFGRCLQLFKLESVVSLVVGPQVLVGVYNQDPKLLCYCWVVGPQVLVGVYNSGAYQLRFYVGCS